MEHSNELDKRKVQYDKEDKILSNRRLCTLCLSVQYLPQYV
jgi:hypothetical protein